MNYKDYYPPAKLRTLCSLLEVYKNNSDIEDEARDKLFGSRAALAKELGAIFFDSQNDQTFANKIDALAIDVPNKSDKHLEELWFTEEDYPKLWWSLVYFVNQFPLRPMEEEETPLDDINPEELLIAIDKQVVPAVRIMLRIANNIRENRFGRFCEKAIEVADTSLEQYKQHVDQEELNGLLALWEKSRPLYYLALAICIVKELKLVRRNGIDIDDVIARMEEEDLLSIIFDNKEQEKTILDGLKEYFPEIKTTWHACAMLAYIIYSQQLIKENYG